jgi:phosphoglycolate phosphatase
MTRAHSIVFDLDGTLVDSAVLCAGILNEMLRERGSERVLTVDCVKPHMSCGGAHLISAILGDESDELASDLVEFRRRYAALPTPELSLFEGVSAGLRRLAGQGFQLAICSNKPQHLCDKILTELALGDLFKVVIGSAPGRPSKPDPRLMELTLNALGAVAEQCIFVGDSDQDYALAEASGVKFRFVTYGYCSPSWRRPSSVPAFGCFSDVVSAIEAECSVGKSMRRVA